MSYIVALGGSDGIVIASDGRRCCYNGKRRKGGDTTQKVFKLGQCCAIGFTGSTQPNLVDRTWDLIEKEILEQPTILHEYVDDVLDFVRRIAVGVFRELKCQHRKSAPGLSILVAGYERSDADGEKPVSYTCTLPNEEGSEPKSWLLWKRRWAEIGSDSNACMLSGRARERASKVEHLIAAAVGMVIETANENVYVGGRIRVSVIEKPSSGKPRDYKELTSDEVCSIAHHNDVFVMKPAEYDWGQVEFRRGSGGPLPLEPAEDDPLSSRVAPETPTPVSRP
jgi:hypothetical protein